jgi:acylphosphatase
MPRVHVWIEGRVQGVFFRDSTAQMARKVGVAGWVRNLPDGRVEAVFQGEREPCEEALEWVRIGPPSARVSDVEARWEEEQESLTDFRVRF